MELLTPLESLCRIIIRARENEAQVPAQDPDEDADNVDDFDDEGGEALSVLEDELNSGVEEELRAMLDDLADDQLAETLALAWVGRGMTFVLSIPASQGGQGYRRTAQDGGARLFSPDDPVVAEEGLEPPTRGL